MNNNNQIPIKIHVVGSQKNYMNWIENAVHVPTILESDIVLFTGGEDVGPSLYGEERNPRTSYNLQRDFTELAAFKTAREHRKKMLGICRGAQLLCALSGGRLIQDQDNPGSHPMVTIEGDEYMVNSLHHQAMFPYEMLAESYKLLGWTEGMCGMHQDGFGDEISDKPFKEAEVVYFPKSKALGIQFHPEMMSTKLPSTKKTLAYCNELVNNLLNNKL